MTKILNGLAQPDIEATKGKEKIMVFVETSSSLRENAQALKNSFIWLKEHQPKTKFRLVHTVPKRKKQSQLEEG